MIRRSSQSWGPTRDSIITDPAAPASSHLVQGKDKIIKRHRFRTVLIQDASNETLGYCMRLPACLMLSRLCPRRLPDHTRLLFLYHCQQPTAPPNSSTFSFGVSPCQKKENRKLRVSSQLCEQQQDITAFERQRTTSDNFRMRQSFTWTREPRGASSRHWREVRERGWCRPTQCKHP